MSCGIEIWKIIGETLTTLGVIALVGFVFWMMIYGD